jgi:hypothetical protein
MKTFDQDGSSTSDSAGIITLIARGVMLIFGLMWTGGVLTTLSFIASELNEEVRMARVYKPVTAVVTAYSPATTKTDDFGDTTSVSGKIEYRYRVGEKSFNGSYYQTGLTNEYTAKFRRAFKKNDRIEAWYDPDEPYRNTLEPIANPQLLGFVIFIIPFIAVGLGSIWTALTGKGSAIKFSPRQSRHVGQSARIWAVYPRAHGRLFDLGCRLLTRLNVCSLENRMGDRTDLDAAGYSAGHHSLWPHGHRT